MGRLVAYCGIVCSECPAYAATIAGDMAELERVAERWRKEFGMDSITVESITCAGCSTEDPRKCGLCAVCDIRACARQRQVATCAHCEDYACERLERHFQGAPAARQVLDEIHVGLSA